MKIICIKDFKSTSIQHELTYLKIYDTIYSSNVVFNNDYFYIICDNGTIQSYSKHIFMTIEDYRQSQLDMILEKK